MSRVNGGLTGTTGLVLSLFVSLLSLSLYVSPGISPGYTHPMSYACVIADQLCSCSRDRRATTHGEDVVREYILLLLAAKCFMVLLAMNNEVMVETKLFLKIRVCYDKRNSLSFMIFPRPLLTS